MREILNASLVGDGGRGRWTRRRNRRRRRRAARAWRPGARARGERVVRPRAVGNGFGVFERRFVAFVARSGW